MAEHFKLPTEVLQPARAFIGLVGLNHVQNAVHRTIWDAFTVSRKQDRLLINFKSFNGNHEYPKYTPRDQVSIVHIDACLCMSTFVSRDRLITRVIHQMVF